MSNAKIVKDYDLKFLESCEHREVKILSDIIIHSEKDREERWNQRLTKNQDYKNNENALNNAVGVIVDELLRYGGDTVVNLIRRHGVSYKTIVCDICLRLHIHYAITEDTPQKYSVMRLEKNIIERTLEYMLVSVSNEELSDIYDEFCGKKIEVSAENRDTLIESIMENAMPRQCLQSNTINFLLEILKQQENEQPKWYRNLCKYIRKPNLTLIRITEYNLIAGPAFRVLFPAVLCIACLRIKYQNAEI